ncbi:hypothetical protein RhiLY_04639 [Ceratobasidium sp. AG-Ba]|nr:hypothetical protein RhiLY_04639 [Ceratobasidium sp. AG-Ba]
MPSAFERDTKRDGYEPVPISEGELLVVGLEARARRKRFRRHLFIWLFSFVSLLFVGHLAYKGISTYMFVRHNVECVPYESGTNVVKIPIVHPYSKVFIDSSVSSNEVSITRIETESSEITFTLEGSNESLDTTAEIRLCTLKGRKMTGLGIFAHKKDKHEEVTLPVIKSLKIEIPKSIPTPSIDLLPPKRGCHKVTKLLRWAGVWGPEHADDNRFD